MLYNKKVFFYKIVRYYIHIGYKIIFEYGINHKHNYGINELKRKDFGYTKVKETPKWNEGLSKVPNKKGLTL